MPYSITEEFVAVYRMHPLLPDELSFRSVDDNAPVLETTFPEVAFAQARDRRSSRSAFTNALYSFGTLHPGAITLHNFPTLLQRLTDLDGILNDLAAIDILRIRERGVPRYNDFRELLHKPRLRSFEELSDNPEWVDAAAARLRRRHRQRRPDGRPVRRAAAAGLRVFRHGVPDLHPDGLAAA